MPAAARIQYPHLRPHGRENDRHRYFSPADCTCAQAEKQEPLGIRYEIASFSDLSIFKDESFDTVVSTMALMDSPDFDKASRGDLPFY